MPPATKALHFAIVIILLNSAFPASTAGPPTGEPVDPPAFRHARVTDAWQAYDRVLTFGKGQTLALVDDGCTLSMPEWSQSSGVGPKVLVSYDSVDGDNDPRHEGKGYHGSTVGIPSSVNYKGKWGVAYNDQVAVIRALECCHCNIADSRTLAAGLQWVLDNHKKYRITTVNLAPVDDKAHDRPIRTEIDANLTKLRQAGIWVSAPTGNHDFTTGISWPACEPDCFAIGAVKPGQEAIYLDRHAKVDLLVPAAATSSSNAIACGAAIVLREAIEKTSFDWHNHGPNLPVALLAIMQRSGKPVTDTATKQTFRRLDLKAALDYVFAHAGKASSPAQKLPATQREGRGDEAVNNHAKLLPGALARLEKGQPLKIVCFGDSVTGVYYHTGGRRAYPEMLFIALRKIFPGAAVSVVNAGISGNSTVDGLKRLESDVLAHRPQVVTVMFGLNDMTRVSLEGFRANMATIVRKCRANGAEVLLCTPNGIIETPGRPVNKLLEYCDGIRAVAREEKAPVRDIYAAYDAVRTRDYPSWRLLLSDEIHPNMDGHKLSAQEIARAITGQSVSLKDVGPPEPAIPRTLSRLRAREPIRVLAMPPFDTLIGPAFKKLAPSARVEVSTWPTAERTLPQIQEDAQSVRKKANDLVLLAVPPSARADSEEQAIVAWSWILNWSLSFAHQEWDVVGVLPSVGKVDLTPDEQRQEALARRMIRAQDLNAIERGPRDVASAGQILTEWLRKQLSSGMK